MESAAKPLHLLADLFGCPSHILKDEDAITHALVEAAAQGHAEVVDTTFHKFPGGGVTGVVAVKESHLTIHTWPERGYAAVDVFMCGKADPWAALKYLIEMLHPAATKVREHERGKRARTPREPYAAEAEAVRANAPSASMLPLYVLTLIVAACSIVYELLLAQTLSALLGNTVLRYSVTIGCYLGALGLGAMMCAHDPPDVGRRFVWTELALAAIGGMAVPLFYFLDMGQRYFYALSDGVLAGSEWVPVLFLLATHVVIVTIGILSGFEVPLLLALGRQRRAHATNRVLGVDYVGSLIGSVLFPIVLLRHVGLLASGFLVAMLNALACLLIFFIIAPRRRTSWALGMGALVTACLGIALLNAGKIEQYFLKKFYFAADATSLTKLIYPMPERPEVERYRSPYQTIDIVYRMSPMQWALNILDPASSDSTLESLAQDPAPSQSSEFRLYLNRDYQVYAGVDQLYHEWFVHAPIQAVRHPPRKVLVLGGGDGLAIRELLGYPSLEKLVHVDIDPEMIRLADTHPVLATMNGPGPVHADPRVTIIVDDAFHWLRTTDETFDAIYIDMPYPRDYNLAQVYSREFYALARHRLDRNGFLMLDAPDGSLCDAEGGLWGVYYSTLRAAGFARVVSVVSIPNPAADSIASKLDILAYNSAIAVDTDDGPVVLTPPQLRKLLVSRLEQIFSYSPQEFLLALPRDREVNTQWTDMGVDLDLFGPAHLQIAFRYDCPEEIVPSKINSLFRPILPPLDLLAIKGP